MRKHPFLLGLITLFCLFVLFMAVMWSIGRFGFSDRLLIGENDVAIIDVEGPIVKSKPIIDKLLRYRDNESIKAIIIRINSPGGGVGPSQEIYEELMKLRAKKKIIASMESVAASGGYYIACAAHKILANPGTITGSIGVIIEMANVEELMGKIGLKAVVIKSGKYKDILSPVRNMTQEERDLLQSVIDSVHNQFIEAVAKARQMPKEKVIPIADGRIFSGAQAQSLGLIDELGDLQDAIAAAGRMAGIKGEPRVLYPEKHRPSILEFFIDESVSHLKTMLENEKFSFGYVFSPESLNSN